MSPYCRGIWLCRSVQTYPATKKGKQINSSAKWEFGEKVVLQVQSQVYGLSATFSF